MASEPGFVEYVCDQMGDAGRITYRKMFGEFALYCDGTLVALVCDDQLFVKPTAERARRGDRARAPGAQTEADEAQMRRTDVRLDVVVMRREPVEPECC